MDKNSHDNKVFHPKKLTEGEEVSLGIPAPQPEPKAEIVKRPSHSKKAPSKEHKEKPKHHESQYSRHYGGDIKIAPHARGDFSPQSAVVKNEANKIGSIHNNRTKINLMPEHHRKNIPQAKATKTARTKARLKSMRSHRHWHNAKLVVGTVLVFLLIFNSQWFISQIMYLFNKPNSNVATQTNPVEPAKPIEQPQAEIVGPENVIIIPKINVTAPLIFPKTTNEPDVLVALRDGVVHYYGTAMPGENGNAAFFGHSSNDWWEPGNYKFVFVILERLSVGDTYEIHYNSRKYVYQVTETKVVAPNDLSVLNQTAEPTSTLITCTPPGTSWRRFVVSAKQISPQPKTAELKTETKKVETDSANSQLPSAAPSIWDQIKSLFNGLLGRKEPTNTNTNNSQSKEPKHLPEVN
jgi:LPXTG-site transpeptidase (sortase) family protein